jgi:nucleotidyltransferase substrate binding protein (TIGR01987 family)
VTTPQTPAPIDLEAFASITARLGQALADYRRDPSNLYVLDSVIERFELTYELAFRNLRRYLIDYLPSEGEVNDMSFAGIIRRADKEGLVRTGWPAWRDYKEARNHTVHTYREAKARDVAEKAALFLPEAEFVLAALQRRTPANG